MANAKKHSRQKRALARLDAQLVRGVKPAKQKDFAGVEKNVQVPLTDKDIARINKERAVLQSRI